MDQAVSAFDEMMLADLREWRRRVEERGATPPEAVTIMMTELDALLEAVAERDVLKREACADPDERPVRALPLPAGHAVVKGVVVPIPRPHKLVMHIAGDGGVLCGAPVVSHVTDGRRYADCPACIAAFESNA